MSLFFKKLNNADLWNKIQKLRQLIQAENYFKTRTCWNCGKDLNIYDFLSDNVDFTPDYILKLWQTSILEFHCCECFRYLKINELNSIEKELEERKCLFCEAPINIFKFSKFHNYLKIFELRNLWLDPNFQVFCDNLCQRKYYKTYYDFLNKKKLKKQDQLKNKN